MLDVNLRLRGVRVSEAAEEPCGYADVAGGCGWGRAALPGVRGYRTLRVRDIPTREQETVLTWARRRFECDECVGAYWERLAEFAG